MANTLAALRNEYLAAWAGMKLTRSIATAVKRIVASRARYEAAEVATGVPWWFIAIIHMRESTCDFKTYLGNGDPLRDKSGKPIKSKNVPRGRGPFASWEDGAIDALRHERFVGLRDWSLAAALFRWEKYNGFGPRGHGMPTGYLWAGTSAYRGGKYVKDHVWSAKAKDAQPGCAAMLRGLIDAGHLAISGDGSITSASPADALPDVPWHEDAQTDPAVLSIGSTGSTVANLQHRLRSLGYGVGAIDGIYGEKTADAVAAFQRRHDLSGAPGAWQASYNEVLATAPSTIGEDRSKATPSDLEKGGDFLVRVARFFRNLIAWLLGLVGITVGADSTLQGTLTEAQSAATAIAQLAAWAKDNSFAMLLFVGVAAGVVLELTRQRRAQDYRNGDYQGPNTKPGEAQ